MPVNPDRIDRVVATLADLYGEAETAIVRLVTRELSRGIDQPTWTPGKLASIRALRAGAQSILAALSVRSAGAIRDIVAESYRTGWRSAVADLPARFFPRSGVGGAGADAAEQTPGFAAMEALAQAVHDDVGVRSSNVLRDVLDAFRAVQTAGGARVLTGVQTRRQASQSMWSRFVNDGIMHFTDIAGRRWKLSTYVEMAGRTIAQRAAITGQTDRLTAIGHDLIIISDHPAESALCRPYENKVLRVGPGPTGDVQVEHAIHDGQMVTVHVMDNLDGARAKGLFHPNCFPGEVLVSAPSGVDAADSRWYEGDLVVIHTAGGDELPVTPNHPVLTPEGWVAAGALQVGQSVVRYRDGIGCESVARPDDEHVPARIGDVFHALRQSSTVPAVRVPSAAEQFHGDGTTDTEVEVVLADRLLKNDRNAVVADHGTDRPFVGGGVGLGVLLPEGTPAQVFVAACGTPDGVVRGSNLSGSLLGCHPLPLQPFGLPAGACQPWWSLLPLGMMDAGPVSAPQKSRADNGLSLSETLGDLGLWDTIQMEFHGLINPGRLEWSGPSCLGGGLENPSRLEPVAEVSGADADGGRDLYRALAGQVTADDVVEVEVRDFAGHVYNLQTGDGWYVASGIVVHNCRHAVSIYLPGVTKQKTGTADPEGDKARQEQRRLERNIRAAKEHEAAAMDDDARTAARRRIRQAQADMRAHLAAHPKLRRLPYRESIGAGNIPAAGKEHHDQAGRIGAATQPELS